MEGVRDQWAPHTKLVAIVSRGALMTIVDPATKARHQIALPVSDVADFNFSPDGKRLLLIATSDETVVWLAKNAVR